MSDLDQDQEPEDAELDDSDNLEVEGNEASKNDFKERILKMGKKIVIGLGLAGMGFGAGYGIYNVATYFDRHKNDPVPVHKIGDNQYVSTDKRRFFSNRIDTFYVAKDNADSIAITRKDNPVFGKMDQDGLEISKYDAGEFKPQDPKHKKRFIQTSPFTVINEMPKYKIK